MSDSFTRHLPFPVQPTLEQSNLESRVVWTIFVVVSLSPPFSPSPPLTPPFRLRLRLRLCAFVFLTQAIYSTRTDVEPLTTPGFPLRFFPLSSLSHHLHRGNDGVCRSWPFFIIRLVQLDSCCSLVGGREEEGNE